VETVNWVVEHGDAILLAGTSMIAAASAIAALTPTPKDDKAIKYIRKVIDVIAMNVGHAKPKKAK
jgi:hypothetical protein